MEEENTAPIASNDYGFNVAVDSNLTIQSADLLENDFDADGDDLTITSLFGASNCDVTLNEDGTISFMPFIEFSGIATFYYSVTDNNGNTDLAFAAVKVGDTNTQPLLLNQIEHQSFASGEEVNFTIPANTFVDLEGNDLTYTAGNAIIFLSARVVSDLPALAPLPVWLSFDAETQTFSGTPPEGFNDTLFIELRASDGELETSQIFSLEIISQNAPPDAVDDDGFVTAANTALTITVADLLANDSDADGDEIFIYDVDIFSENGEIEFDGNNEIVYTPNEGFTGEDTFTYVLYDGFGNSDSATVTVTVGGGNTAPSLDNPLADQAVDEDTAINFTIPDDAFSDIDGDELTYSATLAVPIIQILALADGPEGSPLPEWLTFDPDTRTFSGTPPPDYNGSLDVTVTASDGEFEVSDTFTLEITPVNDAPVLDNPLADQAVDEDTQVSFTIPDDAFSDPEGTPLTYTAGLAIPIILPSDAAENDGPIGGPLPEWLSFDPGTLTFSGTPPADFNGSLDVVVTASDGELEVSDTFTLEITAVNDAPIVANALADQAFEEDTDVNFTLPANAFTDVDDENLTLRTSALPAWLAFDESSLTFSGTPPQDFNGSIDVTVTASDGELETSDTFTLEITPVNDGPVANDDDGIEADAGTALTISAADLLANDTDADDDALNIISVESASGNAEVSLDEDGNVVYTASSDFDGDDSFTYTVSDGNGGEATATVNVTVEGDDTTDPYEGWQVGTEGNDNLFGSFFSSNQIYGDAGNDRIFGGFRNDQLDGGEGNDRIYGRWGNDIINGDEGHDRIDGGSGHDIINGGQGNDRLYGNWGNDNLSGGEGNDRLYGHWGKDTISGGKGNDILWGGWDQDNFVFNTGDGADTVTDFSTGFSWWWFRVAGDTITLDVDGIENYDDVLDAAAQNGRHTTFDFGDGDSLTLRYTRLSSLDQDDFTIL